MAISKLEVEYSYDFCLLGVVSNEREYKLAWQINQKFNLELTKQSDISLDFLNKNKLLISNFLFETDYTTFRLLKNKSWDVKDNKRPYLLPEMKETDYLLQIEGEYNQADILASLRSIPNVIHVFNIDVHSLKSKENLLY